MWLRNTKKIMRKGRAISPIIATILLLGITVLAAAAFFIVVSNFLATSPKIDFRDSSSIALQYSNSLTNTYGTGWGIFNAWLRNNGNAPGNIQSISVLYSFGAYQGVVNGTILQMPTAASLPLALGPNAEQDVQIAFPLVETLKVGSTTVDINNLHTTAYVLKITTDQGSITSDTKVATSLGADSPQLSSLPQQHTNITDTGTGTNPGVVQFAPSVSVPSGGTVTQVSYTISNSTYSAVIGTITSPDFSVTWNSRMAGQPQGGSNHFANGVYNLIINATDNAGISTLTKPVSINIANDYYKPYLTSNPVVIDTQSKTATTMINNNVYQYAQQGYAAQVKVNVADNVAQPICTSSGCSVQNNVTNPTVSSIDTVTLNYKLTNASLYTQATMANYQNGTFSALIPASTTEYGVNTSFYFVITDGSGNQYSSANVNRILKVHDTIPPTVVVSDANSFYAEAETNLVINATLADLPGSGVNPSTATLYYARGSSSTPPPQGSSYTNITMSKVISSCTGSCVYTATIASPAIAFTNGSQSFIYYYVGVSDYAGNINNTDGTPAAPYLAQIRDTTPPTFISTTFPTSQEYGYTADVQATITDNVMVHNATIFYRLSGITPWYNSSMSLVYGSTNQWDGAIYTTNFSAYYNDINNITIQYYVLAYDNATTPNAALSPSGTFTNLVIYDKQAPVIISSAITSVLQNTALTVQAYVTDNYLVQYVNLWYHEATDGNWHVKAMNDYSGNFYNTTISVNSTGTGPIYYYIQSADPAGNTAYSPTAGQSQPQSISITSTAPVTIGAIIPVQGTPQHTEGRRWIDIYIQDNKTGDTISITSMMVNLTGQPPRVTTVSSIRFTPAGGSYTIVSSNGGPFNSIINIISYPVTGTNIYIVSIEFNDNVWRFGNQPQWSTLGVTFTSSGSTTSMIWSPSGYISYSVS